MGRRIVVSSANERYFPLVKGLYLSLLESDGYKSQYDIGFIDIGCSETSVNWLKAQGIRVFGPGFLTEKYSKEHYGYHMAQICRPYLPELLTDWDVIAWVDSDAWFQDPRALERLFDEADQHPSELIVSVESHFTYIDTHDNPMVSQGALEPYYRAIYGDDVAGRLSAMPGINSGFFLSHRDNDMWRAWKREIEKIYIEDYRGLGAVSHHFGEQIALNMLLRSGFKARLFDPIYNYLCCWKTPFRDVDGVVRTSLPPYTPVGMVHLAGGWRHFGNLYKNAKLLYRCGSYLTAHEEALLDSVAASARFR